MSLTPRPSKGLHIGTKTSVLKCSPRSLVPWKRSRSLSLRFALSTSDQKTGMTEFEPINPVQKLFPFRGNS
uniref:Ovule protein n=1 Tax=Steinernema glaseri TaxID=37863 RepID=A0A1I8AVI4_9BILA